jgi:hypothetical protein
MTEGTTRREFVTAAGGAAMATLLPGRAGALSCLTGIAARKSTDSGQPVKIADLVRL